eukprot:683826-Pelagomonas_calceolata.AAC.9
MHADWSSRERKKERLCSSSLAVCIKERSPVLTARVPPHRPRGRASTKVYSSKLAPTWDLRHGCQTCPVQQAKNPPLSPKHALQPCL